MAELEVRTISGKGILLVNKSVEDFKKGRVFTLYASVIRKPFNEFLNFSYNPPRSRYATLVFLRDGHVVRTEPMEYQDQAWDFHPDPAAQALYAVKCSYAGILQTFFNLGNALNLPSISITNNIEEWYHIDLMWDAVKVVCYADTAIRLQLISQEYDLCPDDEEPTPKPPPPPPDTAPVIPPGTPLNETSQPVSDAYDEQTDDGDTIPYPGDENPPPPPPTQGNPCLRYDVVANIYVNNAQGNPILLGNQPATARVYGIVGTELVTQVSGATRFVYVQCQGLGQGPCQTYPTLIQLASFAASTTYRDDLSEIVSVTLVP